MYKVKTLDNGLTIIGEEISYLRSVSMGVWVNVGSRMEDEKTSGTSHFIEHLLFKGTKNRTAKELVSEIDNIGGQINAFTSKECTCYYVKLLDEHIDIGIDILSDMVLNSTFDKVDIKKERSIIIEELKMYEDSPDDLSYDLLIENIFRGHSLGMNIIGTEESLNNMDRESILEYFNKFYVPNNTVISISGNVDFDEVSSQIEEKFKAWENRKLEIEYSEAKFNPCFITKNKDTEQVNMSVCLKGVPTEDDTESYAIAVVNNILGSSISSRLFQKIREERGLVYSIYSSQTLYRKCGELGIFCSMSSENVQKVYKLILEEVRDLRENYITDDELEFSKEQLKGSLILDLESTTARMSMSGRNMLLNKNVKTTDEIIECINKVDLNAVKNVINKVFNVENMGVCLVGRDVEEIDSLD